MRAGNRSCDPACRSVGDDTVLPVRGQIVRVVVNPGLTLSVRDEPHPVGFQNAAMGA
jgi:hypothetical protein